MALFICLICKEEKRNHYFYNGMIICGDCIKNAEFNIKDRLLKNGLESINGPTNIIEHLKERKIYIPIAYLFIKSLKDELGYSNKKIGHLTGVSGEMIGKKIKQAKTMLRNWDHLSCDELEKVIIRKIKSELNYPKL